MLVVGFLPFPLVAFVGFFAFALVPIGELTSAPFHLTGLIGCLMTQIRVFARRKKIDLRELKVSCRAHWEALPDDDMPYSARPVGFEIDIDIESDSAEGDVRNLIDGAKRACFVEATLSQKNDIRHTLRLNAGEAVAV